MGEPKVIPSQTRLLAVIELQNAVAAAAMNSDEVMRIVAERASTLTHAGGGAIALVEGDDLVYRAVSGATKARLGTRVAAAGSVGGRVIAERKPANEGALACVPLLYGEHAVGVLEVLAPPPATFSDEDIETLHLLAHIVAIALHRVTTYPRPRYDNLHDALTGLANRRAFDERIEAELGRNKRYGHSFSLALLDLDGLEVANDRFGQATGDAILKDVATILKKHTRVIDACFRLGGDEFAIVMPGTQLSGAKILAARFDGHIADAKLAEGTVTSTFGVVEAADEASDVLIERARAALNAVRHPS